MKVAIVANCQGESFSLCLKAMNSGFWPTLAFGPGAAHSEEDVNVLHESKLIFAQPSMLGMVPEELRDRVVLFPSISFSGLHPDVAFARGRLRNEHVTKAIVTEMSMYHSAIAIYGYTSGMSACETLSFFNPNTYNKLGYFDAWSLSRQDLLSEGDRAGVPLGGLFERWARRGAFMYSFNHPDISTMADVVKSVLKKIDIPAVNLNVAQYLADPLRVMPIWPIYPEIGARYSVDGNANFVCLHTKCNLSLSEYIESCYRVYDEYDPDSIEPLTFSLTDYRERLSSFSEAGSGRNPYAGAPKVQFWKDAVANVRSEDLDPVVHPKFAIARSDSVATAGSCFAQHIARTLGQSGFNYYVSETAGEDIPEADAKARNYGVFSARYGNMYTVRQFAQLFDRIDGRFQPVDRAWRRKDGKLVDPFRPQIEPAGFSDEAELLASREAHFESVRTLFSNSDVVVFTLGLTEGWRSKMDGAVFPLAPGVAGGQMDPDRYEFVNFSYEEIVDDLHRVIGHLSLRRPGCRVLFTVSPVPLIATFEPKHALVATTYSKSVLRAAADAVARAYAHVDYFPSYEIITGSYNHGTYYDTDLRTVTEDGVAHVMRMFMRHYAEQGDTISAPAPAAPAPAAPAPNVPDRKRTVLFDIVCDEEAIANFEA